MYQVTNCGPHNSDQLPRSNASVHYCMVLTVIAHLLLNCVNMLPSLVDLAMHHLMILKSCVTFDI